MPDAIVLCGGAGTRLRGVTGESPKAMAIVAGRPFLGLLFAQLKRQGFRRVILASGYQSEAIRSQFGERVMDLEVIHSVEKTPLGTGGAIALAARLACTDVVVVMNGDSYTEVDLKTCVAEHRSRSAEIMVVVATPNGRSDAGNVSVTADGVIADFQEKTLPAAGQYISAGIYVIATALMQSVPPGAKLSLELGLLPHWLGEGRTVRAYRASGACIDIGTPERYRHAQTTLADKELELRR